MPLKDLMQNQLSAADLSDMNKSLDQLQATIKGKMVNLTPEERQKYGSINEQNKLLVNKVNDLHTSQPNFDSSKVNWVEFESDFATRAQLEGIITRLRSIAEQLDDTKILHDNDNYQAALSQFIFNSCNAWLIFASQKAYVAVLAKGSLVIIIVVQYFGIV